VLFVTVTLDDVTESTAEITVFALITGGTESSALNSTTSTGIIRQSR
jgi:hypothetical protein